MDDAGWIVAIGSTEGLSWELGELTGRGHLAKSEFIVPPVDTAEQQRRWSVTRQAIDEAAGGALVPRVAIAGTFSVHVDPMSGEVSATRADRLDEAGHRASIEAAFEERLERSVRSTPRSSSGSRPSRSR